MKKTLVALAVLAASGASFAQVKLTGEFAYGYQVTTAAAGNAGGWGTDTSMLQADVTEDLGGGMSIAATMGVQSLVRKTTPAALNTSATLITPYGAFTGGTIKSADFLKSYSNVGGTWYSLDGLVTPARTQSDIVAYAAKFGAIGVGVQHNEPDGVSGLGTGAEGSSAQRSNSYTLTYSAGALNAGLGFVQYGNQGQAGLAYKDAVRVGVNYDLGVAKVGAAIQQVNGAGGFAGGKAVMTSFGVNVPFGAVSLAANWQQTNVSDTNVAAVDGSNSGYNLQATYNLSKTTYVIASYNNYTGRSWTTGVRDTSNSTQTNLILVKDF